MSEDERPTTLARQRTLEVALSQANAAREVAEEAHREIVDFLDLLSHELRSPLAAIRLQLELLAREQTRSPSRKQSDVVARIARSSSRLAEIVDSFLRLAGLESGRVVPNVSELDLNTVASQIVERFRERAAAKALTIRLDEAPAGAPIASDPELVEVIVEMLCDNAINHASASEIVVAIDRGASERATRLCIQDGGPGMPTAESQLLEQLENAGSRQGSRARFALSVVKRIAAALGAEVAVEDVDGFGFCVSVSFPISPPPRRVRP